ncbi:hypothetical protein [Luteolibacter soli]|uniref:Secreted protein n=1 Tax=Luteolibacter soli TaxID=3135280 RepID=A0ABU9AXV8_9BACT
MKTIFSSVLLSLAILLAPCPAQEANPYLGQQEEKAPLGPSGDSFLTLTEHVLVPADLLDSWLAGNPTKEDASELRAAVQRWIHEGKATLDHSALSAGTVGRVFRNESTLEQIYATEYIPPSSPEEWAGPTSFETRNMGYGSNGDAVQRKGELTIRQKAELCKIMLPHRVPDKVSEESSQPGDIFVPNFRVFFAGHAPWTREDSPDDTFDAELFQRHRKSAPPSYPAGKIYLALRADEDLPEPIVKKSPDDKSASEAPTPLPANRLLRLIFVRSDMTGSTPGSSDPLPTDYHVSGKIISVDHLAFSDWLQGRDLATASSELDQALETWNEDGKVKILRNISGGGRNGTRTSLSDIKEVIYPTEFEPGKREPGADGKSTQWEFALATAFETRNVGGSLDTEIESDEGGPLLNLAFDRVAHGGFSVHHRILRDGEWVPDITMPLFSCNNWNTSLRLKRGEWMLVGSGSAFGENSQFDPSRVVLAFVKVE